MLVTITFNDDHGGIPYTAASVQTPCISADKALNYAFEKTQNVFEHLMHRQIFHPSGCFGKD